MNGQAFTSGANWNTFSSQKQTNLGCNYGNPGCRESHYSKRAPLYLQTSIIGASHILNSQSGISEKAGAQWGAPGVQTDKRKTAFVIAVQVHLSRMQSSNCAGHLFCEVLDL